MMHQRVMQFLIIAGIGAFLTISGLTSCSDSVDPTEMGTLRMVLTDAPTDLQAVDSLMVVFKEVRVHRSSDVEPEGDGWFVVLSDELPEEARTFDLLQLVNGVFATLGEVELETGRYNQVRIMLESATLYVDGVPQNLSIPSGAQTGIKLVGGFTIEPNVTTVITADFDVARSLHESPPNSGLYVLRPTIRLAQNALTGTISGTVIPPGIGAIVCALYPTSGDTASTTLTDAATGAYVLPALMPGIYYVRAEADGYSPVIESGITVTAGGDTPGVDFELLPVSN